MGGIGAIGVMGTIAGIGGMTGMTGMTGMGSIDGIAGMGAIGAIGGTGGTGGVKVSELQTRSITAGGAGRGVRHGLGWAGGGGASWEMASIAGATNNPVITIILLICVISIFLTAFVFLSGIQAYSLAGALASQARAL